MKTHLPVYTKYSNNQIFRIAINKNKFHINDQIKNEQNLIGTITEQNDKYIIVSWDDNTFERIKIADFQKMLSNKELIKVDSVSIKPKKQIINANASVEELVNLAIEKGIIDASDKELEMVKVEAFDKKALNEYKKNILNFSTDGDVYSLNEDEVNIQENISEEEKQAIQMLNKLRPKKIQSTININNTDSRSLKHIKDTKNVTFANIDSLETPINFEDSLMKLANNTTSNDIDNNFQDEMSLDDIISEISNESTIKQNNNKVFLNTPLQGLTRPLITGVNKDNINPVNSAFSELFSPEMWSTISR